MQTPASLPVEDVVAALYRVMLMRDPDAAGLAAHAAHIIDGSATFEQTLAAFFASDEFRAIAPRVLQDHDPASFTRFTNDHSQFGEFGILLRQWVNDAALYRVVVDAGARGRERSNSYDLLRVFGWRGLLIEANPALIAPIAAEFAGTDFTLLNHAVSDYDGTATLHIGVNDDVSSLTPQAAQAWGDTRGEVQVEVRRLEPLLRDHAIPSYFDLLSLDLEGEDIKVLNDLIDGGTYRPRFVIIEASHDYATGSLDDLAVSDAVRAAYRIIGQTQANLILKLKP